MYKVSVYDVLHRVVDTFTVTGYTKAISKLAHDYPNGTQYDIRKIKNV